MFDLSHDDKKFNDWINFLNPKVYKGIKKKIFNDEHYFNNDESKQVPIDDNHDLSSQQSSSSRFSDFMTEHLEPYEHLDNLVDETKYFIHSKFDKFDDLGKRFKRFKL